MSQSRMLSLFGMKWNPFCPEVPEDALVATPRVENFCARMEQMTREGGFAVISGEPGLGKSVILRMLNQKLQQITGLTVGVVSRPQSSLWDFYCELSTLFAVNIRVSRRWHSYQHLRERWLEHIEATNRRPVLLIDEAQEVLSGVLSELRLLSSTRFDSLTILTVVLCGDTRFTDRLSDRALAPLDSRVRVRLKLEPYTEDELLQLLDEALVRCGAPHLMTAELQRTLAQHSLGNPRLMMNMAHELLLVATERELKELDEKLFLQVYAQNNSRRLRTKGR